jgi:predicted nucleic acid-binding protein
MEIVVNEWLLDYSLPNSQKEEKELLTKFVTFWIEKCHKVIIRITSPFGNKFYSYMKANENDQNCRERFKTLLNLFYNMEKTKIIYDSDVQSIPTEIDQIVPADDGDRYLLELAFSSVDKVIVTTDKKLKEKLKNRQDLKIYLLDEFIAEFQN